MIEFILEVILGVLMIIGIAFWLGILSYAISKGWHKAKAEHSNIINKFSNPFK